MSDVGFTVGKVYEIQANSFNKTDECEKNATIYEMM